MKEKFVTDAVVRQFLLGDVDEEERHRIEGLFVSDPDTNEKILIAEADLIEDYLEDSLTTSERDMFLSQYGNTPQQRRDVRITRSIKDWAVAQPTPLETATPASGWLTFLSGLRLGNPRVFIPVAAILLISFIVSAWLLQLNGRRMQENTRRAEIERELVDLNRPSIPGEARAPALSIVLPPVSVRSVEPQPALNPKPETRVVELQLLWTQKEQFQSYRAVLRRVGNPDQFIIPNLHLERDLGGSLVRLRVPAHLFGPGLYQVRLSGIAGNVPSEQAEEYTFMVRGQR
jgi:hypothetical protein